MVAAPLLQTVILTLQQEVGPTVAEAIMVVPVGTEEIPDSHRTDLTATAEVTQVFLVDT